MHQDGNVGTIEAIEKGLVTSASTMMPCSWVPMWNRWLKQNPTFDNGVHLTLTSEWSLYRWGPVAGRDQVPSLVDKDGYLWKDVLQVVLNAKAEDVEKEIRAQIRMARAMEMPITHLDSHMGTLFARPDFLERYVKVAVDEKIPLMIMGGHMSHLQTEQKAGSFEERASQIRSIAQRVWAAGLPVLDDLQTDLTSFSRSSEAKKTELARRLAQLRPGVTMIIVHCARPSDVFPAITGSAANRLSDTEVMLDSDIRQIIDEQGIILTTWRELLERRKRLLIEAQ
jgi:chitin disaccharide deacetylase